MQTERSAASVVPSPGQLVYTRSRRWLVDAVTPRPGGDEDDLVRLSCVDDDAQGESLDVLWQHEVDAEIVTEASWTGVTQRGFDAPNLFAAYLHALRWSCVTATNPKLFQAPYRAGIEVMAYQLEPLRKALQLPFVNLFIADDVGLGKTIEAGLVLRELMIRQKVRRVVVACPPSVVQQWRAELEQRFGLHFVVYDRDYLIEKRQERGFGVNPFATHSRFIISHALLRDEQHASLLRDWITNDDHLRPEFREPALFVLDEAHNAAPASGAKYAIDSKFTRVIRGLAPLFEHRLFLSATPHNGHSNSFSALLEILDPQRFCRGVKASPKFLDAVMVRRLKSDLREAGQEFPERRVIQVDIAGLREDAPELELARLLDQYRTLREDKVKDLSKSKRNQALVVLPTLQKRLLSSIEAFARTLRVHRKAVQAAKSGVSTLSPEVERQLIEAPDADDERGSLSEEDLAAEEEQQLQLATSVASSAAAFADPEKQLLDRMTDIAEAVRDQTDPRVKHLLDWLRDNCLEPDGKRWSERRVLIFTEFNDTKRYVEQQLRAALAGTDRAEERIETFHGSMEEERREVIKRAFNAPPDKHPLRILIATDAAREGVNLQNHCADLFHFDVPWNPSRMEQRNGRIDRKLQRAAEVRCHYFVLPQRPEDRVLQALVRKTKNIQAELGSLSQVLEARLGRMLEGGIRRAEVERLTSGIEAEVVDDPRRLAADEELEKVARAHRQALAQQMNGLRDMMETAKHALAFDERPFRAALDAALELADVKPLTPSAGSSVTWSLPSDAPLLRDPSWAETLDLLRAPKEPDQKIWDWRKAAAIRPFVFRDVGTLDESTVHLHLEHRFVQRLLGRLTAQGFVHDDLARACALVSDDPIPRVALLGRLSLYGERAARLHDEIIAVTARWADSATRQTPLAAYADETRSKTLDLIEKALDEARRPSTVVMDKLKRAAERDVRELLPLLSKVGEARRERASDQLFERGKREADEIGEVLETQRRRIQEMLDGAQSSQLGFGFNDDERRQLEADQRHWKKRLGELARDVVDNPAHVRRTYEVRASRVEPIGLVYLWPVTG